MTRATTISFDDPKRKDRVTLAIGAVDAVTGELIRGGVAARITGLKDRPIVNASGMLVFINLPDQPLYDVEVDGRRAGFPFLERFAFTPPAAGNKDPAARRRDVLLAPGPDYRFAPGTTLIRGVVTRGSAPVAGASISAVLAAGGASFATRSIANGAFALALRLPALGPHEAEAPVPFTIAVSEGGDARSFVRALASGRGHSFLEPIDLTGSNDPAFFDLNKEQVMAQDDRKGQPPGSRGATRAPTAPDTPASRDINAPPPPEAPDAPAGAVPPAKPGAADAGASEEGERAAATEGETERLRGEVRDAKKSLEAKEEALALHEAQRKTDEAAATMVSEYAADVPALEAHVQGLRQYRAAETSFLEEILPVPTRTAIAEVDKAPRKKIDDLRKKVEKEERDVADARRDLTEARATAHAAKQRSEALKRPAASIKDRLNGADAVRSDAKKASDAGNYALAYWLIMEGGKLDQAIRADPEIIAPEALAAAIKTAAAEQAEADKAVEGLESRVEALDASLQQDRAELANLQRTVDATILTDLAKLNPRSVEAV